jgi:hypothetical protein
MTPLYYFLLALLVVVALYVVYRLMLAGREFLRFGGKMLVTCPETKRPAAVKVDNWHAAVARAASLQHVQLSACSRWPERQGCAQDCLCQLEDDPEEHKVWNIAAKWYAGRDCAYCGRELEVTHLDHPPALMDADKKMKQWTGLPAEHLQEAFATSVPVCWNCYITESFVQDHPGSTVIRPWKHSPPWAKN